MEKLTDTECMVEFKSGNYFNPERLTPAQETLSLQLFDIGSIIFGDFRLKLHESSPEAPLSPIYINLRNLPEDVLDQAGKAMADITTSQIPDFCTGIPNAGDRIAKIYSQYSGIPYVDIFRKEQTSSGRRILARSNERGKGTIRLIDDVVTRADTKLEAIDAARNMGFDVIDVFVLVDREQRGREQLAEYGCQLHAVLTLNQILSFYLITGMIDKNIYQDVIQRLEGLNKFLGV